MERHINNANVLCDSVYCGSLSRIHDLLTVGADPNFILPQGISAFHLIVGLDEISQAFALNATGLMLQYGADPNIRNSDGVTPVHIAAMQGRTDILRILLHNGGNPLIKDKDGQDSIAMATENEQQTAVRIIQNYLLECDCDETASRCEERDKTMVTWTFNGYVSSSDYDSTCCNESARSDFSWPTWRPQPSDLDVFAAGEPVDLSTNKPITYQKTKQPRKSFYNERLQPVLNDIDTRCQYLDVTSPDHPLIISRSTPDTTLATDLNLTLDDKEISSHLTTDDDITFGHLARRAESYTQYSSVPFDGSKQSLTKFTQYRRTSLQQVPSPGSEVHEDISSVPSQTFYSCEDERQLKKDHMVKVQPLEMSQCSNCSNGNSEFCLNHRKKSTDKSPNGSADSDDSSTKTLGLQCQQNPPHDLDTHNNNDEDNRVSKQKRKTIENWLTSFQDLKEELQNMSLMTLDDSNFEQNIPNLTNRYVVRSAAVESTLNDTFTVEQRSGWSLQTPVIDHSEHGTDSSSVSSNRTVVYNAKPHVDVVQNLSETFNIDGIDRDTPQVINLSCETRSQVSSTRSSNGTQCTVEEYIYTDNEASVRLVEWRCPPNQNVSPSIRQNVSASILSTSSVSDWRSYATCDYESEDDIQNKTPHIVVPLRIQQLSNEELSRRLQELHDQPGPITQSTRQIYLTRLTRLEKDPTLAPLTVAPSVSELLPELLAAIRGEFPADVEAMEEEMSRLFVNPDQSRKWREGTLKSSFNYLILDPRVTQNLPLRVKVIGENEAFRIFLSSIFYIGKGKRARPFSHFYEAVSHVESPREKVSAKIKHIVDIWQEGLGAVTLHCFQNVIPVEAYTREACMVDAFGLFRLTNVKKGDYYGIAATWSAKKKRQMGAYLLKKAFNIFINEGEHQIRPLDLKVGQ